MSKHGRPMFCKICTEGSLQIEFCAPILGDDGSLGTLRIKTWTFTIRRHHELVPRSVLACIQDPSLIDQLTKNITKMGFTSPTLNFLKISSILEPMQELMARHKVWGVQPPKECLRVAVVQRVQALRMSGGQQPPPSSHPPPPGQMPYQQRMSSQNDEIKCEPKVANQSPQNQAAATAAGAGKNTNNKISIKKN